MKKLILLGVSLVLLAGLVIGWGSIRKVGAHAAEISPGDLDMGVAPACTQVSAYHVLIVYSDLGTNARAAAATGAATSDQPEVTPVTIRNQILAEAGVATVDLFDAGSGTPTLAQLTPYEEVIVFSNTSFTDATAMGNVLADYQDTSGVVVAFNFVWFGSPYGLAGRWMTGGYTPFNDAAPAAFTDSTLGTSNAGHSLMQGITTLNGHYRNGVTLASGAALVASWADAVPMIAVKTNAGHTSVAVNNYVGDSAGGGGWSGQFGHLAVNAARWLKPMSTTLNEGFESGTLNTFNSVVTQCVPGGCGWGGLNTAAHAGTFSAFVPDVADLSDQQLTLANAIIIPGNSTTASLTFWHRFAFEGSGANSFDGGVLETSIDGGASWQDAGSNITAGGYNGTISGCCGNPLAGQSAWVQNPNGTNFVQVTVNLLPYAGQNLRFRFREGTDNSVAATGWWVDDIQVVSNGYCGACPPPAWTAASVVPGGAVRYAFAKNGEDLYITSGLDSALAPATATRRYNATTNAWTPLANIPIASEASVATYFNGKIYEAEGGTAAFQIYDIAGNTWSSGPARPSGRSYGAAAGAFNGNVYVVGGVDIANGSNIVSIYNIAGNSWSLGPPAPANFFLGGHAQIGQFLYLVGGFTSVAGTNSTVSMRLDMATNTWTTGPVFTPGRADFGLAASGTKLVAIGGDANGGGYFDISAAVDELETSTWPAGAWVPSMPDLPSPRQANEAGFFSTGRTGGEVWTTGGFNGSTGLDANLYRSSVCAAATISGTITYGNAIGNPVPPRFVRNVSVASVSGTPSVGPVITGAPGTYSLSGFGASSYTIKPTKPGGANAAITSNDAARIAQGVSASLPFVTLNQKFASDASGNGSVSSTDAALVARFAAGLSGAGNTGQWRFFTANLPGPPTAPLPTPPYNDSRTYASVTSSVAGEDYIALLIGEASGNYNPATHPRPAAGPERGTVAELPQMTASTEKEVTIPVTIRGAAGQEIISYEFNLIYDPSVLQPLSDPADLANTVSRGLLVVTNPNKPGVLRVVVYGPLPIDGDGVLLNLKFTAVGKPGSVSPLTWERVMFNEGDPQVSTTDGQIELSE